MVSGKGRGMDTNHYLNHLDRVLYYLDEPDLQLEKGKIKYPSTVQRIRLFISKIFNRIARIWNYFCGDGYGYNELKARKIVCYYLDHNKFSEKQSKSIVAIYDRLKLIQNGNKTYADGIDAQQIDALRPGSKKIDPSSKPVQTVIETSPKKLNNTIPTISPTKPVLKTKSPRREIFFHKTKTDNFLSSTHKPKEFDQKKLEEDSLSHKFNYYSDLATPSLRMMMNLHGNRFGKNSNLEGFPSGDVEAFLYLQSYLNKQLEQKENPAIRKFVSRLDAVISLKKIKEVPNLTAELKNKFKEAFKSKTPLLMPAGWIGNPAGHDLYFEIFEEPKNSNQSSDTVSMRIYNTGEGLQFHPSAIVGNKNKFQPYILWRGIKKKTFLDTSVLKALAEMRLCASIPKVYKNTDYHKDDIYGALKEILNPSAIEDDSEPSCLISEQSSGVCGTKGLLAVLRTYLEEEEGVIGKAIYKRLKCDIKIQSLLDYMANPVKDDKVSGVGTILFVTKSIKKVCRAVDKLYHKKLVGDSYLEEVSEKLNEIGLNEIDEDISCGYDLDKPCYNKIQSRCDLSSLQLKDTGSVDSSIEEPKLVAEQIKKLISNGFQGIDKILDEVHGIGEAAWKEGLDQALYAGLIYFVNHLPISKAYWEEACLNNSKNVDKNLARNLIVKLEKLAHVLFKSCFTVAQSEILIPERIDALKKICIIQKVLTLHFKPSYDFRSIDVREVSFYISTKEQRAKEYRYDFSFTDGPLFISDEMEVQFQENHENIVANIARKNGSTVLKSIINNIKNFSSLSTYSQDAEIYASSNLPDWLAALRNSHLYMYYLHGGVVGKPVTLDRAKDLQLRLTVEHGEEESKVKIGLEGINVHALKLRYPVIEEYTKFMKTHKRYMYMHGEISFKPLFNFFDHITSQYMQNEKGFLVDQKKYLEMGMKREEYQELYHIFSDKYSQPIEAIEYFNKHSEKLKLKEYQILFRMALFHPSLLILGEMKGIEKTILKFIDQQFKLWEASSAIQGCVYLVQTKSFLRRYFNFPADGISKLRKLLKNQNLEIEDRSIIYAELVAQLAQIESSELNDEDIHDLLVGLAFLKDYPVPKKWHEPLTDNEVRKAAYQHESKIREYLFENGLPLQKRLNAIFKELRPDSQDVIWRSDNAIEFRSTNERYLYRPIEGHFFDNENGEVILPDEVRNHSYFQLLCKGVSKGIRVSLDSYVVGDFKFLVTEDSLAVIQKVDNDWVKFIPSEIFIRDTRNSLPESSFGSRYLIQEYSHWLMQKAPYKILFQNLRTKKFEYSAKVEHEKSKYGNNHIWNILEIKDKEGLKLRADYDFLSRFENPAYIHAWYDPKSQLRKIEIPCFSLSFTILNDKIKCDQFTGFCISKEQSVKQLGPYQHYLVIKNSEQRKVLIPYWKFIRSKTKVGVYNFCFDADMQLEKSIREQQHYFVYDVDSSGQLRSRSEGANLYLVQILTAIHAYREAAKILKKYGFKITPYNKLETKILEQICEMQEATGDHDGNAAGIRTYAGFLLLKNGVRCGDLIHVIVKNYREYLNKYSNSVELRLKLHEEVFLLTTFLEHHFEALFFLRLRELNGDAARMIKRPNAKSLKQEFAYSDLEAVIPDVSFYFNENFQIDYERPDIWKKLITRAYHDIHANFWKYYGIAVEGNKIEKNWLYKAISFLKCSKAFEEQRMGKALQLILDNSSRFTMPPVTSKSILTREEYKRLGLWRGQLEFVVKDLQREVAHKTQKILQQSVERNLTPSDFQIGIVDKANTLTDVKIALKVSSKFNHLSEKAAKFFDQINSTEQWSSNDFSKFLERRIEQSEDLEKQTYEALQIETTIVNQTVQYGLKKGIELAELRKLLTKSREKIDSKKQEFENRISELCNRFPADQVDTNLKKIAFAGDREKPIIIEEVIVCFARHKQLPNALQVRNSALTSENINEIFQLIYEYLLFNTEQQQRKRALNLLSKIEAARFKQEVISEKDLIEQLGQELCAKHSYDPFEHPYYLAFEYFADVLLRPEQIEKLKQFLDEGDLNIVVEMIMGFGKSKILMPLLALLLAKPGTMSLLVCPPSLFENIASDTQHIVRDAFGQTLHSLNFDRNSSFTKVSLLNILNDLREMQKQGDCLLMTGKSLQCLLLKFIEAFNACIKNCEKKKTTFKISTELMLMQEILNCFENSKTVIDEADSVLNVLRKVCFSLGNRFSPVGFEVTLISKIYQLLYSTAFLKKIARLESDPDGDMNAPMLTEMIYQSELKDALAEEFLKKLSDFELGSEKHDKVLKEFSASLEANKEVIHCFLTRHQYRDETQKFFNEQCYEIREILALASQIISQFLPHTLTRVSNEKYGIDLESDSLVAIPFLAANTPSKGSLFSNHHITMMYTFQAIMKNGVNREMILNLIERLQSQAMFELRNSENEISFEDTKAWKNFELLKGNIEIALFTNYRLKPQQLDILLNQINKDVDSKLFFAEFFAIPQLSLFEEHISCNAINLSSFLPNLLGFTGTLWNSKSLHRKLNAKPAEGINAKTLNLLFSNSRQSIVTLEEGLTSIMLDQLKQQISDFDVIIDAGGYFKRGTNLQIAREMAKWLQANTKRKYVVFYNHLGEQTITDGEKEFPLDQSSIKEIERVVFLDQDHTIGADVSYKQDAIGVLTCGPLMIDRDFKQGAWRLRRFDKLQTVVFALSKDVEKVILQTTGSKSKILLDDIVAFVIANQCRQQSKDNFKSFLQQLWDIPQQILISFLLCTVLKDAEYLELFKALRSLWIKPGMNDANKLYGNIAYERLTSEIVIDEKGKCETFLKDLFAKCSWLENRGASLESTLEQIDELIKQVEASLPKRTVHPEIDSELSMELEVQEQEEVEREVELEIQQQVQHAEMTLKPSVGGLYLDVEELTDDLLYINGNSVRFPLKLYFEIDHELNEYAKFFDDLDVTLNVFALPSETKSISEMQLFGVYRTPLHFVDIENEQVTILSQLDAANAIIGSFKGSIKEDRLYNLSLGYCKNVEKPSVVVRKKIVKVKFLNGDMNYTEDECKILMEWLKEAGPERMKRLFIKKILAGFPEKAAGYHGSALSRVFKKLISK